MAYKNCCEYQERISCLELLDVSSLLWDHLQETRKQNFQRVMTILYKYRFSMWYLILSPCGILHVRSAMREFPRECNNRVQMSLNLLPLFLLRQYSFISISIFSLIFLLVKFSSFTNTISFSIQIWCFVRWECLANDDFLYLSYLNL